MSLTEKLKKGAQSVKGIAEELVDEVEDAVDDLFENKQTHLKRVTAMQQMIGEGKMLEAFDQYYDDDVVMIEATGEVRNGKATSRTFLEQFLASIKEVHGGGPYAITSNEKAGVTMVESWMDVTFQDGNRVKMEEVAVQQWKGDKIVRERFYYNAP